MTSAAMELRRLDLAMFVVPQSACDYRVDVLILPFETSAL
jgi:hypothetical protein